MSDETTEIVLSKIIEAQQIMKDLYRVAELDDRITDDEKALLENISHNIERYKDLMDTTVENKKVTNEEFQKIHIIEKKIIQDASSKAFEDGKITDDERALLNKIIAIFENINEE